MNGILNVNKAAGMTSYAVVARVRHISGQRRTGHAGTLDPDATGVLPVCLGQATRIIEFLMETVKVYRAEIELGTSTDTYDAAGQVTATGEIAGITRDTIETALHSFRGVIQQTPPMYSALKHQGQPLYRLARAGITIERPEREVVIHRLELLNFTPPLLKLEVECSKGTYIRSLAHDLGQALGCGGHLRVLQRTRTGIFGIDEAVTLEDIEAAFNKGESSHLLYPIDSVLQDMMKVDLDEAQTDAVTKGQTIALPAIEAGQADYLRAYNPDGRFMAILSWREETAAWGPKKVFLSQP